MELYANTSFALINSNNLYSTAGFADCTNLSSSNYCICPTNYVQDDLNFRCRTSNYYRSTIDQEGTFSIAVILISTAYYLLAQYIRDYASTLIEKQNVAHTLAQQNQTLRNELNANRPEIELDLDSPLTKVIKMIRGMQGNNSRSG